MIYTKILLFILIPIYLFAGRAIDIPFTLSFDTYNYSDLLWLGTGATHTWDEDAGWSGSCAKFTPPTASQQMMGLGQFSGLSDDNMDQINIRFLVKHGSAWIDNYQGAKFVIVVRDPNDATHQRPMLYDGKTNDGTRDFISYAPALGTYNQWDNDDYLGCWIQASEGFKIYSGHYLGEWICIELEFNLSDGETNLYITTQDGEFGGLYLTYDPLSGCAIGTEQTGGDFDYIDIIGGFYNNAWSTVDENTYILFDELEVNDSYIGPPSGFILGEQQASQKKTDVSSVTEESN